jgi:hypothetical protein
MFVAVAAAVLVVIVGAMTPKQAFLAINWNVMEYLSARWRSRMFL